MAGEAPFEEQLDSRQFEEKKSEYRRRFDSMFGGLIDPGETASALLRTAIDRLKTDEYLKQAERVRILFSQQWTRIVDLLVEKAKEAAKTHADTRGKLNELDEKLEDYLLSFEKYASTFKGRNTPYGEKEDTFDVAELVEFEKWAQSLRGLNPAELIDTLEQNGVYENTLLVLQDESGEFQKKLKPNEYIDFHNPKSVEHFVEFILGNDRTNEGKIEKSRFRIQTEYLLWMEIVRRLNYEQKETLVLTFLEKKGAQTTKEFIARGVMGGLITRVELTHMYDHNKDKFVALGTKTEFDEFLKAAAVEKEKVDAQLKDYAKQIETPQIRSAIVYFSTFNKLIIETAARCGAITAVLNSALCIVDRWNARKGDESHVGAVLLGCIDAAHDPYVLGGTAAAIAGYDYIHPFVRDWVNSPDAAEIEHLARNRDYKYLQEMRQNRHEVTNWFTDHYEDLRSTAQERLGKKARNPRTGEDEIRKEADLYPEDLVGKNAPEELRITPEMAKNMGYDTPEQAMIPMIRMFNICTRVFAGDKIDTREKLEDFLAKADVYEKEPHGAHA